MSDNNFITPCSSAPNMEIENQSDVEIALHEMSLNEIQSQVENLKQNGEQMMLNEQMTHDAYLAIRTNSDSLAIVQEAQEETKLIQNNTNEQNPEDESSVSSQQVKEESPALFPVSEATNLLQMPSTSGSGSRNVTMVMINVSCSHNIPVETTVTSNLPTSVNTSTETNGSEVLLTKSAENDTSETLYEENRFDRQRVQVEDPIIISSDDGSDIDTNVPEHSTFHSIADPEENAVTDQTEANYKFNEDFLYPTTDIRTENEVNDQQEANSSDVPPMLNPNADMSLLNKVHDQQQTNGSDVLKDSFNSIDENQINVATNGPKDSLDSIADVPKNAVITEQTNSTSANDNTERYNRNECQLKVLPAFEQNQEESCTVTIRDELDHVSIDTGVESEGLESPTKGSINVTECNKQVHDDVIDCVDDDTEDIRLIVSEDDSGPENISFPSKEFSDAERNSTYVATDEVILLSDTEEAILSNEEDEISIVTTSRSDNQILIDKIKSGKLDLMNLYPILNLVKATNEAFTKEEPIPNEILDIGKRFVDASIQTKESDVHATSDPDEMNCSVVDLASDAEVQIREASVNADCKVLKLEEKTDEGQSSKLTKRRAEKSHDNNLTAMQFRRSSKKAKNTRVNNDDVYMTSKDRKHFKTNNENLTNDFDFIKRRKRSLADSYQTSTPIIATTEKKPKYSFRRGFFGKSISNLATKWRDQGQKIKSKLGFKVSPSLTLQRTNAGNFSVTAFPKEEDCQNVSGFSLIPAYYFGGGSL